MFSGAFIFLIKDIMCRSLIMFIQGNRKLASKTKLNMSKTWSVNVCAFLSLVRFSSAVVVVS